ncbi:MAG TPA: hypothetical protein DD435_08775 [Cyanobacteria bacterium UBA8530]|nr:hypothetical protein [Cyanobacteria bacterium UBA8530]
MPCRIEKAKSRCRTRSRKVFRWKRLFPLPPFPTTANARGRNRKNFIKAYVPAFADRSMVFQILTEERAY